MRSAVLLACSAAFVFAVHADDRWVCSPSSDGTGWQCSGTGTLPTRAIPAAPTRLLRRLKCLPRRPAITLDWVPRSELPASRLSVLARILRRRVRRARVFPPLQKGELETLPMHAEAQQLQYWVQDRADLSGSVEVTSR